MQTEVGKRLGLTVQGNIFLSMMVEWYQLRKAIIKKDRAQSMSEGDAKHHYNLNPELDRIDTVESRLRKQFEVVIRDTRKLFDPNEGWETVENFTEPAIYPEGRYQYRTQRRPLDKGTETE